MVGLHFLGLLRFYWGLYFSVRSKKKCMFAVTWSSLLKGTNPWTIFGKNLQKMQKTCLKSFFRYNNFFYLSIKKSEICIFCVIQCDQDGFTSYLMTWVYLNLTRFCFSVPCACYIEKNIDEKKVKIDKPYLPNLLFLTM